MKICGFRCDIDVSSSYWYQSSEDSVESTPGSVGLFWILVLRFVVAEWCRFAQLQGVDMKVYHRP